jgi:hypothetical protein
LNQLAVFNIDKIINTLNDLALHKHRILKSGLLLYLTRLPGLRVEPEVFMQDQVDLLEAKFQTKLPDEYKTLATEFCVFNLGFEYNDERVNL